MMKYAKFAVALATAGVEAAQRYLGVGIPTEIVAFLGALMVALVPNKE